MSWGNEGKCISEFWSHAPRPYQTISTFTWLDMVPPQPANSSTTVSIFECGWQDSCLAVSWHTIPYFLAPWWGLWALILQYVTVLDAYILHAMYYACIANSTWSWDHGRSVLVFVHRHPFTKPANNAWSHLKHKVCEKKPTCKVWPTWILHWHTVMLFQNGHNFFGVRLRLADFKFRVREVDHLLWQIQWFHTPCYRRCHFWAIYFSRLTKLLTYSTKSQATLVEKMRSVTGKCPTPSINITVVDWRHALKLPGWSNSAFSDIGSTSCEGASLLGKQKGAFRRRRSTSFCRLGSVWHGRWLLSGRTPTFPWIERLPWPLVPGNGMLNADAASLLVCLSSIQAEIGENLWYQTSFRLSPKHYMCQDDGFERHTVVLVGVTGDGKSSTGNTLQLVCLSHHFCLFCSHPGLTTMQNTVQNTRCGLSTFPVSAGFKSETQDSWFENVHRNWNTHSKAWVSW